MKKNALAGLAVFGIFSLLAADVSDLPPGDVRLDLEGGGTKTVRNWEWPG